MVLLEAILFGSLLLYFPVSLWLEPDPTSWDPPQSQPGTLHTLESVLCILWGDSETSKSPCSYLQVTGWPSEA